jgi:GntR family transcriptional regulator
MTTRVGMAKSERVAQALGDAIRQGRVSHGDLLESEGSLMQRFGVSRNTVRRGLDLLVRQGMITRRTGIGSFVTYDGTTIDSNLGWTVALAVGAGQVETRTLDIRRGPCAKADAFLGVGTEYLCVDRLRFCHDTASGISLERSRVPWRDSLQPVLRDGLRNGSLNQTLTELGLTVSGGQERADVVPSLSAVDATIMRRGAGQPMLRLQRMTRCANGDVLEYVESLLDPVRFGLRMDF